MNKLIIRAHATRFTTREGDHPDDLTYFEQLRGSIEQMLKEFDLTFVGVTIELVKKHERRKL